MKPLFAKPQTSTDLRYRIADLESKQSELDTLLTEARAAMTAAMVAGESTDTAKAAVLSLTADLEAIPGALAALRQELTKVVAAEHARHCEALDARAVKIAEALAPAAKKAALALKEFEAMVQDFVAKHPDQPYLGVLTPTAASRLASGELIYSAWAAELESLPFGLEELYVLAARIAEREKPKA